MLTRMTEIKKTSIFKHWQGWRINTWHSYITTGNVPLWDT